MPNKKRISVAALYVFMQATSVNIAFADVIWLSEMPPSRHSSSVAQEMVSEPHGQHDHSQHPHEHPIASSGAVSTASMSVSAGRRFS